MEDGLVIKVLGWDNGLDDMLHEVLVDLVVGDIWGVLGGYEDGVYSEGNHGTILLSVLNGHLGLAIWPEPGQRAILASLSQAVSQPGGKHMCQGHELWGLVCGIAKHVALVTSTQVLQGLGAHAVHSLANVRALLLDVDQDLAGLAVEANILAVEPNPLAGVAHDLLVVDVGLGGDLAKDHDHVGLGGCLAGNLHADMQFRSASAPKHQTGLVATARLLQAEALTEVTWPATDSYAATEVQAHP